MHIPFFVFSFTIHFFGTPLERNIFIEIGQNISEEIVVFSFMKIQLYPITFTIPRREAQKSTPLLELSSQNTLWLSSNFWGRHFSLHKVLEEKGTNTFFLTHSLYLFRDFITQLTQLSHYWPK